MAAATVTLQVKYGTSLTLPASAAIGELLYTTDTQAFYVGNGPGQPLTALAAGSMVIAGPAGPPGPMGPPGNDGDDGDPGRPGRDGTSGIVAGSAPYAFSTATAVANPGSGWARLDNATPAAATRLVVSTNSRDGLLGGDLLAGVVNAGTSSTLGVATLYADSDRTARNDFFVTGVTIHGGVPGWYEFAVTFIDGASGPGPMMPDGTACTVQFVRVGDKGDVGQQGTPGPPAVIEGLEGPEGQPGAPGRDGTNGVDGAAGQPGPPVVIEVEGPEGPMGPPGRDGFVGSNGLPGLDGPPAMIEGPEGPEGQPGLPGHDGAAGATGNTGPVGPAVVFITSEDYGDPPPFPPGNLNPATWAFTFVGGAGAVTGTVPIPAGCSMMEVEALSAGGGGGAGRQGASASARHGGNGGNGGSYGRQTYVLANLGLAAPATVYYSVGAWGTGGAAVGAVAVDGPPGTAGGDIVVKKDSAAGATIFQVKGGGLGAGGSSVATVPVANLAYGGQSVGGTGGQGNTAGTTAGANAWQAGAGGGGGSAITSANAVVAGAAGGDNWSVPTAASSATANEPLGGSGGAGGTTSGSVGTVGWNYGGGGGGGGATLTGTTAGSGAHGGPGVVRITFW